MNQQKDPNKVTAAALDTKAIAGVEKYFANATKVTLLGTDFTPATLVAKLQSEIDALVALDAIKAQAKQKVADTRIVRTQMRALRAALKKYILGAYGAEAVQMLEDFGMTVPKNIGKRTAAEKAASVAKADATRKAKKDALERVASGSASASTTPAKA
jgi:hypothetical protein